MIYLRHLASRSWQISSTAQNWLNYGWQTAASAFAQWAGDSVQQPLTSALAGFTPRATELSWVLHKRNRANYRQPLLEPMGRAPLPAPRQRHRTSWPQSRPVRLLRRLAPSTDLTPIISRIAVRSSWRTCRRLGSLLGLAHFYRRRSEAGHTVRRLRAAFPHLSDARAYDVARRAAQSEKMRLCELLRLPAVTARELSEYTEIEGLEHLKTALADGCGVVCPTAHFGPFEIMGAHLAQQFEGAVIVNPFYHPVRQKYLAEARQSVGIDTFPGAGAARLALAELRANKLVGIFADLPGGPQGLQMPVLGRLHCVQTSPARLALATGAPIVPMFAVRCLPWIADGRILIKIWPPLRLNQAVRRGSAEHKAEIQRGTRYILDAFEQVAQAHPEEWELWR